MRAGTRKGLLHGALIAGVLATTAFALPVDPQSSNLIGLLLLAIALTLIACWKFSTPVSSYQAPEFLADRFERGEIFETDGLCFVTQFAVEDGMFWLHVHYQNRYDRRCMARISVTPMEGWDDTPTVEVPALLALITCEGGEVGIASYPSPIAASRQGKIMIYDVTSQVTWPDGHGSVVRGREGRSLDRSRVGKLDFRLPAGVAETLSEGVGPFQEVIWRMEDAAATAPDASPT